MKKLIVLLLILVAYIPAQTKGWNISGVTIWSDSLKTASATVTSDSVYVVNLGYAFEYPNITVTDTGSAVVDTIECFKGAIIYNNSVDGTPVDTVWSDQPLPLKDYTWTDTTLMVGGGNTKTYTILDYNIHLLKVLRMNTVVHQGNKTGIIIEATMKRGY